MSAEELEIKEVSFLGFSMRTSLGLAGVDTALEMMTVLQRFRGLGDARCTL